MNSQNTFRKLRFLLAISLLSPALVQSAEPAASEYAVKSAIVFKITKFVVWPEAVFSDSNGALNICLTNDSPFVEAMSSLEGRSVRGNKIKVIELADGSVAGLSCQVLLISGNDTAQIEQLLLQADSKPVLTIGDSDNFAHQGGIIGLELQQSRVRFAINVAASDRAGLNISSQLLQLAKIVEENQPSHES
jgi:hypothetical protein